MRQRSRPVRRFLLAVLVTAAGLAAPTPASPASAAPTVTSAASGRWSDPATWALGRVPSPSVDVVVATGHRVVFDLVSGAAGGVVVEPAAELVFHPSRSTALAVSRNVVVQGTLTMRPDSAEVDQVLRFVDVDESAFVGGGKAVLSSDVGLWVQGGRLDVVGTSKTAWTKVAGEVAAGATKIRVGEVPRGWRVGDEITLTPTEAPNVGDASWAGFDEAVITGLDGSTITFDRPTARPHPVVNGTWSAEVVNLSRNVRIEGTPSGRAHVWINSPQPQTVDHAGIRYMGPRRFRGREDANGPVSEPVLGRYGLHFHESGDGSRGSSVTGTVLRDIGNIGYAPHSSHGITFRDCVGYGIAGDGFSWDEGDETHDTVVAGCLIGRLTAIPAYEGQQLAAFVAAPGERNVMRDNVAVGVQGNSGSSGYKWREGEGDGAVWTFTGNVGHNNRVHGAWIWQVTSFAHPIERFLGYHNGDTGIFAGAYGVNYQFVDSTLYGNGGRDHRTQLLLFRASAETGLQIRVQNVEIDAAGQSDFAISLAGRRGIEDDIENTSGIVSGSSFKGYRKAGVVLFTDWEKQFSPALDARTGPLKWYLENNTWHDPDPARDFFVMDAPDGRFLPVHERSVIDVRDARHGHLEVRRREGPGMVDPAWNARVTMLPGGVTDTSAPTVGITSPVSGEKVADGFVVIAEAADTGAVERVEFYDDGSLVATDRTLPYGFVWSADLVTNPLPTHSLTAVAYDAVGNSASHTVLPTFNQSLPALATSRPAEVPVAGDGLKGEYFRWSSLGDRQNHRLDPTIDFAWGRGKPDRTLLEEGRPFGARWTGFVQARYSEPYTFTVVAGDAVRLWVGGALVLDSWTDRPVGELVSVPVPLQAGQATSIKLEYSRRQGPAGIGLWWSSAGQAREVVPQEHLFSSAPRPSAGGGGGAPAGPTGIWPGGATPAVPSAADPDAVELGVRFRTDVPGQVTGIRFYKGEGNDGPHVGSLWTDAGERLATVAFDGRTGPGWQEATLDAPVPVATGTTYVVSYHAPNGRYAADAMYFGAAAAGAGPVRALPGNGGPGNGVYRYGAQGGFPTQSYRATNYWVDVVFLPDEV